MTKTIVKFEIEESLLEEVDAMAAKLGVSRNVYVTTAIAHALRFHYPKELTAEDEANAYLLWSANDEDDDNWLAPRKWDEEDGPDNSRLN
ncbi:protein of unknown function [Candidatus Promineifilum breve]|uniref:Uncharacterized protein n=1 Tax=Candidatus Promineifilum breve TaxID=1806508 RepID=A0A160T259_9CHLR|nr:hypothetical protein [Candidatus Promineifilum breve]CUS03996.2 protein of unknown function [Candidatus Promineifilum breve]